MAFRARNLFNDAMTDLVGGAGPDNRIVAELTAVQQMLSAADRGATHPSLHTHNSIDQLLQNVATVHAANSPIGTTIAGRHVAPTINPVGDITINPVDSDTVDFAGGHAAVEARHQFVSGDFAELIQLIRTHAHGASTHDVTPSQPVQPPTQTQTADPVPDNVTPLQPAQPPTSQPVSLTHTATAVHSSYDGQVIENLDIYVNQGDAVTITNDNVTLRNVRIHHAEGEGVQVSDANNVTIENVEIINSSPPSGNQDETSENINNIYVANSPNLTVHNAMLKDGSSGIYLVNSPGADISHVDGYNFHGPLPRGQFVQFNSSGNSTLTDFYVYNDPNHSAAQDNVSAFMSPNVTVSNGVIDGNNSTAGVGVMFEDGSTGGQVYNVDTIHMGNGAFAAWDGANNTVFNDTRSFDNIHADQGRGFPSSNSVIWAVNAAGVSIQNSTYTDPGNPGNIVWEGHSASSVDVHEAPNATPMEHIVNHYAWS